MKALLILSLLLALALAGCTSSGPATPTQDGDGNYVIHETASNKFTPANAKVPVGATVVWVNLGGAHDVQGENSGFSSGPVGGMKQGDKFNHTFESAGTFTYFCNAHVSLGMKGTVVVE